MNSPDTGRHPQVSHPVGLESGPPICISGSHLMLMLCSKERTLKTLS